MKMKTRMNKRTNLADTGRHARWIVTPTYRSEHGPIVVDHHIEELCDLPDLIEDGPNWNSLMEVKVQDILPGGGLSGQLSGVIMQNTPLPESMREAGKGGIISKDALDDARKTTSDVAQRDKTYADLADAEKQAAASGDWAQFKKNVQSIEKAAGDYPGDSRFQLLARRVASDLEEYTAAAAMPPQDIIDYLRQKNERSINNISPTSEINSAADYIYIDEPLPSPHPQKRLPINSHHKRSER
jgi:hypothetical protein